MALYAAASQGMNPNGCVCPGDILTYECTVMGQYRDSTIWTGTVFRSCEITLLHHRFPNGIFGVCNKGAIVALSVSVKGNLYTSQLSVLVTPEIVGSSIECLHDNGSLYTTYLSLTIPTTGLSPFTVQHTYRHLAKIKWQHNVIYRICSNSSRGYY